MRSDNTKTPQVAGYTERPGIDWDALDREYPEIDLGYPPMTEEEERDLVERMTSQQVGGKD